MSSSNKRNITINVTPQIITESLEKGQGLHGMIHRALNLKGYKESSIDDAQNISFNTKANKTWTGKAPRNIAQRLIAATSYKARPYRYKPFSFVLTVSRAG